MQRIIVDAKGLACPEPVVRAKKALDGLIAGEVSVLVDSQTARENIIRMAESQGCTVRVAGSEAGIFELLIQKEGEARVSEEAPPAGDRVVYLLDADYIGSNMELGKVLMNGFLTAMQNLEKKNSAIVLISNAVRLAVDGSYVLDVLKTLEGQGYSILICGTCLNYFKIRENVRAGTISNALEILECMAGAARVIKF